MFDITAERLAFFLTTYVVLLFSLSVHESAHAWMALRLGDATAQNEGRISLNPIVHMDPVGTLLFPLLQIFTGVPLLGWAKPTPYDPRNFRRDRSMRQGHMLVAGAGPVSNLILAVLFAIMLMLVIRWGGFPIEHPLVTITSTGITMNVILALFNLVPIPPLDGSKVASYGLPGHVGDRYDRVMEPYGFLILLLLFVSGVLWWVLDPIRLFVTQGLLRLVGL